MIEYWPWWIGALGLAGVCLAYLLLVGRLLGVSGSWAKVVGWRENRLLRQANEEFAANQDEMSDALMAETLAQFGDEALQEFQTEASPVKGASSVDIDNLESSTPWTAHLTFLLCMFVGAFVTAYLSGQFELRFELSSMHSRIFGDTWEVWLALLFGGMMVGFGTQMAGGCTSGHGLSGCARLIPASLLATLVFMVSAVFLSMLMEVMIR
ncbi:MAG: hypothetical protein AMJ55_12975 [Gammaproteobacteria bacterium SG8_15]|nr:MAG: hypothetical protein AMJ55_12975 [Gammaproteobacteria bacterium SG8_15]